MLERLGGPAGAPPSPSGAGFAAASGADLMEEEKGVETAYVLAFLCTTGSAKGSFRDL